MQKKKIDNPYSLTQMKSNLFQQFLPKDYIIKTIGYNF